MKMDTFKKLTLLASISSVLALAGCSEQVGTGDYITSNTTHEKVTELPQYVQKRIDQNQYQITIHQFSRSPIEKQEEAQKIVENINDLTALMYVEGYVLEQVSNTSLSEFRYLNTLTFTKSEALSKESQQ